LNQLLLFSLLAWFTGNPLLAILLVVALYWFADRSTFRVFPDPFRWVLRWQRRSRLAALLGVNPHDRRASFELAELWLEAGRPARALEALRPNLEAGDDDVHTAFVWGTALGRTGAAEPAERALAMARAADPRFRAGEIDLELGRQRLARGDLAGAREALERLLAERPGSVEGRYHLARALDGLGAHPEARTRRQEAWTEFRTLPRFQRSRQRRYAWLMRPRRPITLALAVAAALALFAWLASGP